MGMISRLASTKKVSTAFSIGGLKWPVMKDLSVFLKKKVAPRPRLPMSTGAGPAPPSGGGAPLCGVHRGHAAPLCGGHRGHVHGMGRARDGHGRCAESLEALPRPPHAHTHTHTPKIAAPRCGGTKFGNRWTSQGACRTAAHGASELWTQRCRQIALQPLSSMKTGECLPADVMLKQF